MCLIREASYPEYVSWYLGREARKHAGAVVPPGGPASERELMATRHAGKLRDYFEGGRWYVVQFEGPAELDQLIFLDDEQTRAEQLVQDDGRPNYRTLAQVASNACATSYLQRYPASRVQAYYDDIVAGRMTLCGENRLVLCDPSPRERARNPAATFYLNDGAARALAYLLAYRQCPHKAFAVEAFCCRYALQDSGPTRPSAGWL